MSLIFVEQENYACPTVCKNDIVEYEIYNDHKHEISVGDHIVVYSFSEPPYVSKIIAGPPEEACAETGNVQMFLPGNHVFCRGGWDGYPNKYLILGGSDPLLGTVVDKDISLIADTEVWGVPIRLTQTPTSCRVLPIS